MARARRVLVIGAHLDDEVLGAGGAIARHAQAGDAVTVCLVCQRAYDHRVRPRTTKAEEASARRAALILGYQDLRFLRLQDERLDGRLLDVIRPIEACVREVKPEIVYTHHRGDSNQDHRAVFQASMIACRSIAHYKVSRLLAFEIPSSTDVAPPFPEYAFQPTFYVNITEALPKKLQAMNAYTREVKTFPHPRSLRGMEVLAQKRGMEIGFHAAEAFTVIRDEWA